MLGMARAPKMWNKAIAVLPEGTTEGKTAKRSHRFRKWHFQPSVEGGKDTQKVFNIIPQTDCPNLYNRIYFEPLILYSDLAAVALEQNPRTIGTVSELSRAKWTTTVPWQMETLPAVLIVLACRVLTKIHLDGLVHTTPGPPSIRVFTVAGRFQWDSHIVLTFRIILGCTGTWISRFVKLLYPMQLSLIGAGIKPCCKHKVII